MSLRGNAYNAENKNKAQQMSNIPQADEQHGL